MALTFDTKSQKMHINFITNIKFTYIVARKTVIFPTFFQGELIRNILPLFVIYSKLRARHYSAGS